MSVFSVLRRGRQAAKEHNAKQAEQKRKEEENKTAYKHVPKHAAIDSISSGPSGSRDVDRSRILEQNRRRSAMIASGLGMSGSMTALSLSSGLPRTHSSLSHVSFPAAYASPVVRLPRSHSYSGMPPPTWASPGNELRYNSLGASSHLLKGKGIERVIFDSGRLSRSSSHGSGSKEDSSAESSQEDLEMKPVKAASSPPPSSHASPSRDSNSPHRMHSSHPRRLSVPPRHPYLSPRDGLSRSSSSISGGIPPVPRLPPLMQLSSTANSSSASSSTSIASMTVSAAPVPDTVPEGGYGDTMQEDIEEIAVAVSNTMAARHSRRSSKMARFPRLETIDSNVSEFEESITELEASKKENGRLQGIASTLPTDFDDSSLPAPQVILPAEKSNKLTKGSGSKPGKKNRWSLRGGRSQAVAV